MSKRETKQKKALIIASMASMIDNFNRKNIEILSDMGYEITLAANFKSEDSNSLEKNQRFYSEMKAKGYKVVHIDFSRKLSNIGLQMRSIKQVKKLMERRFDIVHCHSPICSIITRLSFQKYRKAYNSKLLYTAHGFHFYKGAPKKNWLLYYPAEKICSYMTDTLITINKEDYALAKKKMKAKNVAYLPGIGVDLKKFQVTARGDKENDLRLELECDSDDIMLLSVGELSERKNHEVVIKALAEMRKNKLPYAKNIKYYIVGKGHLEQYLNDLVCQCHLESSVKLLGFRDDVYNLLSAADIFVFPSVQEGLPVALMEAMASGLPCIASKIRGNTDLIDDKGGEMFEPSSVDEIVSALEKLLICSSENLKTMGNHNADIVKNFSQDVVYSKTIKIYDELIRQ